MVDSLVVAFLADVDAGARTGEFTVGGRRAKPAQPIDDIVRAAAMPFNRCGATAPAVFSGNWVDQNSGDGGQVITGSVTAVMTLPPLRVRTCGWSRSLLSCCAARGISGWAACGAGLRQANVSVPRRAEKSSRDVREVLALKGSSRNRESGPIPSSSVLFGPLDYRSG